MEHQHHDDQPRRLNDRAWPELLGLLLLRLGPGIIFVFHGFLKLFGGHHDRTVALFLTVNVPFADLSAWLVGALEFLGGLALISGLLLRPFAALLAIEMAIAIYMVRLPQGFLGGWEFELVLLLACLGLALLGRSAVSPAR